MSSPLRIGFGFDVHAFSTDPARALTLGGMRIPGERGLDGHSDADVLLHALMDALLGALSLGDIGMHFPDNDAAYLNADSAKLLEKVLALVRARSYYIVNMDLTLMAQRPKMAPYREAICARIAHICEIPLDCVSLKATTTEHLGFIGRSEGMAAQAAVLLNQTRGDAHV